MENDFTYYAFISYSHKDETWAKWIQEAIERYRLPAIIRKEAKKPLPKKIQPVFLDQTDLGVGKLVDNLHQELEKSRFLIVVCSPNSAQPNSEGRHFIEEEVAHFCSLGREKQIIPVIVEGTPQTAFCPKLKKSDILAIDATKEPKPKILNDLVATILGLRRDELWNRERRRQRRQRIRRTILGALVGVLVAFGGLFAWDANRTVKNYYADYVDSFGLPEGIFQLKESDLIGRRIHYRFEYCGYGWGKSVHVDSSGWSPFKWLGFYRVLRRVVQAHSSGTPSEWEHTEYAVRPPIQEFKYEKEWPNVGMRVSSIIYRDRTGKFIKRLELSEGKDGTINGLVEFFGERGKTERLFARAGTTSGDLGDLNSGSNTEIAQHEFRRDGKGRILEVRFLNVYHVPVADDDGIYGFDFQNFDKYGRYQEQWYLGLDENGKLSRTVNKKGVGGKKYAFGGHNIMRAEYVDSTGRPIVGPYGWMVCVDRFDSFDNKVESTFLDENGIVTLTAYGIAGIRANYDEHGNRVSETFYDVEGRPTLDEDGIAELRMEHDGRGNVTRMSYFGVDGKPTLHKDGYAGWKAEYGECGRETRMSYFGVDGRPTLNMDGYASLMVEYDVRGNITKMSYFGVDGKPILHKYGKAGLMVEYDERDYQTRTVWLGVDGKPTLIDNGCAECRREYDVRGNITKMSYFGVDGKPTLHKYGYAGWKAKYDERGRETKVSYFGVDGKPILHRDGFTECRREYDVRGNETKVAYFGVDGKPTLMDNGYAECRKEYDVRGKITRMSYFGMDGKPILHKDGYAGWKAEYDERGRKTKVSYFGVDGKPTQIKDGYAGRRFTYGVNEIVTANEYLDVSGNPINLREVVTSVEIIRNLPAAQLGVMEGDVWCRLGSYDILTSENMFDVVASIQDVRNVEKELIVARKVEDVYEIRSIKFPIGVMGIRISVKSISDYYKLEEAYKAFCKKVEEEVP